MHLLDTPVVLALRRPREPRETAGTVGWAASRASQSLFLSAITLHELESMAAAASRRDRAAGLLWRQWLDDQVTRAFEARILPVDAAIVRRAAVLGYADARDGLLAATAIEQGLTLATMRTRAFRAGKVKVFDPESFAPAPAAGEDWREVSRAAPAWIRNLFVRS